MNGLYHQYSAALIFVLMGAGFVAFNLFLGSLVRMAKGHAEKRTVYECGEPTIGSAWVRYNSRFYNIALVYLLFDVEVVVLLPAVLVLNEIKASGSVMAALVGLLFFIGLLVLGLAYEWFYGNLDWIGAEETNGDAGEEGRAQ